jgi:hypothetical protein
MNELYFKLCVAEDSATVDSADAEQSSLDNTTLYSIDDLYGEISYSNQLMSIDLLVHGIITGVLLMMIFYQRFHK